MSPLALFIDDELARRGWSTERAAAEAARRGQYVTGETIRKARKDLYREPMPPETIAAIAAAFGAKVQQVQQLDLARWALGSPTSGAEQAILEDPTIPQRDKRILMELLRSMREAAEASRSDAPPGRARRKARGQDG